MKKPTNTLPLDAYQRLLAQQEKNERRARPRHQESTLQKTCVAWFRTQYPDHALMLFAVPNGGGRSRIESAIMKGEGVTAGVADLILLEARGANCDHALVYCDPARPDCIQELRMQYGINAVPGINRDKVGRIGYLHGFKVRYVGKDIGEEAEMEQLGRNEMGG